MRPKIMEIHELNTKSLIEYTINSGKFLKIEDKRIKNYIIYKSIKSNNYYKIKKTVLQE